MNLPAPSPSIDEQRPAAAIAPSGWRRGIVTVLASFLLIASVGGILVAIGIVKARQIQTAMSQPPPPEMPVAVGLVRATGSQVTAKTTVVGTVLAPRMIVLRNEEPGTVMEVLMQPGGTVAKGDVLLRMDTRVERAELESAMATVLQSKSTLRRAEQLLRTNAASGEEVDAAIASAARASAEAARLTAIIDRKELRAPFDANVGLFELHAGQYIDVGTEMVALEGIDTFLNVDFSVPAHVADTLAVGRDVELRMDGGRAALTARLTALDSRADAESRLLKVRARLDSPPPELVPGDSVLVTVDYGPAMSVVLVPRTAVRRDPSGNVVFVAQENPEDQTLRATAVVVTVVGNDDSHAHIGSGLTAGDLVVADGSFKVSEGRLLADVNASVSETVSEHVDANVNAADTPLSQGGDRP